MRKLVLLVLLAAQLPAVTTVAQTKPAPATDSLKIYNRMLQPKEMEADLKLFRDIREKANSGIYRYHSKKETDSMYKWAYAAVKKPLPITGFFKIILQLTDFEGSCHNYTEVGTDLFQYLNRSQGFFPYDLKYLEGKMIFNQQLPQIPAGSRILSINGVRDTTLMQSFYKYLTGDGYTTTQKLSGSVSRAYGVRYLLEYGIHSQFVLTFTPPNSNEVKSATLPAVTLEKRKQNLVGRYSAKLDSIIDYSVQPKYSFRMLDDKTGLLNFRIFSMAWGSDDPAFPGYARWVDSIFQHLDKQAVPNLVIDIRSNPGGSDPNFEQPMMYLTDHDFKENESAYISFNRDEIPYSQYFWGVSASQKYSAEEIKAGLQYLQATYLPYKDGKSMQNPNINPVYHPKQPAYKGQLYLLIDENTASAASHLASLVRAYARNTTIVGVETVGGYYYHNGHAPLVYELPNSKIKTQFSMVAVTQDAPVKPNQPEGRGTMPDYEVWPSYADFMNGKDTQMEYVLRLIREKN